jgi:hypothetical protein
MTKVASFKRGKANGELEKFDFRIEKVDFCYIIPNTSSILCKTGVTNNNIKISSYEMEKSSFVLGKPRFELKQSNFDSNKVELKKLKFELDDQVSSRLVCRNSKSL